MKCLEERKKRVPQPTYLPGGAYKNMATGDPLFCRGVCFGILLEDEQTSRCGGCVAAH